MDDKLKIFAPDVETAKAYLKGQAEKPKNLVFQHRKGFCKHGLIDVVLALESVGPKFTPADDTLIGVAHICPDCAAVKMLDLPAGRVTLIAGPAGSGKTFIADALVAADTNAVKIDGLTGKPLYEALRKVPKHKPIIVCVAPPNGDTRSDQGGVARFAESAGRECRLIHASFY